LEYQQYFENGHEDFSVNITPLVENWLDGTTANHGLGIFLTASQEAYYSSSTGQDTSNIIHNPTGSRRSYYTKKLFARNTEFFFKRPVIEARWSSAEKDDQGTFFLSSALAPKRDNLNCLYLYNTIRGRYQDIPGLDHNKILLTLYPSLSPTALPIGLPASDNVATNDDINITGSRVSTGIYKACFAYTSSTTTIYPVWRSGSSEGSWGSYNQLFTGSAITVKNFKSQGYNPNPEYVNKVVNLRDSYTTKETARFRLFSRLRDWSPTIYTKATTEIISEIINSASFKIFRIIDNLEAVPYGTGSDLHTQVSYDVSGNYFNLDMSLLEPGYQYGIKLIYYINDSWVEQPETFKFRVD